MASQKRHFIAYKFSLFVFVVCSITALVKGMYAVSALMAMYGILVLRLYHAKDRHDG